MNANFFRHIEIPLRFLTVVSASVLQGCFGTVFNSNYCIAYFEIKSVLVPFCSQNNSFFEPATVEVTFWMWKWCKIHLKCSKPKPITKKNSSSIISVECDCQYLIIPNAHPFLTALRESWRISAFSCFGKRTLFSVSLCLSMVITPPETFCLHLEIFWDTGFKCQHWC